jgi:hypothetical protein
MGTLSDVGCGQHRAQPDRTRGIPAKSTQAPPIRSASFFRRAADARRAQGLPCDRPSILAGCVDRQPVFNASQDGTLPDSSASGTA